MAERRGTSRAIGEALLRRQRRLFRWWHQAREGTLTREQSRHQITQLRQGVKATLQEAAAYRLGPRKNPRAPNLSVLADGRTRPLDL
ncbi:MAG: hypothetical protein AAFW75_29315, partial [Cyanobacteria bacterium J06636_16]